MVQNSPRRAHDLLRTGIRHDLISRDQKLSEHFLTHGYATSRNAVREALQMLALEGLVTRLPRFGTKVTGRITVFPLDDIGPDAFVGKVGNYQSSAHIIELDLELVPATPVLQDRLGVTDEQVLLVEHLLIVDEEPIYVRVGYLPVGADPEGLMQSVRRVYSGPHTPHSAIRELFDVEIGRVQATVEAVPSDPRTSRLLGIASGAPILLRERTVFDTEGQPRELSFTHLRGDRAALSVDIPPE